jgi:hypothetical protein
MYVYEFHTSKAMSTLSCLKIELNILNDLNKTQHPFSSVSHGSPTYSTCSENSYLLSQGQLNAYGWAWKHLSTDTSCFSSDVLYNLPKSAVCINWSAWSGNGDYNLNHRGILKILNAFLSNPYTPDSHTTVPPNEYRNFNMLLRWTGLSRFNCLVLPYRKMLQIKVLEHAIHMCIYVCVCITQI